MARCGVSFCHRTHVRGERVFAINLDVTAIEEKQI